MKLTANIHRRPEGTSENSADTRTSLHLILTGFYSGGSSVLAQGLHRAGFFFGDALTPPSPDNRNGCCKNPAIVRIHERLLAANATDWRDTGKDLHRIPPDCLDRMKRLIADYDARYRQWGFNDPRAAFFLPLWYSLLRHPHTIIVYRHYQENAETLLHQESRRLLNGYDPGILRFWKEPDLVYRMWLAYHKRVLRHLKKNPENTLLLSLHALHEGLPLRSLLRDRYGVHLEGSSDIRITPRPERAMRPVAPPPSDSTLHRELDAVWQTLQRLSVAPETTRSAPSRPPRDPEDPERTIRTSLRRLVGPPQMPDRITRLRELLHDSSVATDAKIAAVRPLLDTLHAIGRVSMAIVPLKRLDTDETPHREDLLLLLGELYLLAGQERKAYRCFRRVFALAASAQPVHYHKLAECCLRRGQMDEAETLLKKALDIKPDLPALHLCRASLLELRCDYSKAFDALNQALEHCDDPLIRIDTLFRQARYAKILEEKRPRHEILEALRRECDRLPQVPPEIHEELKALQRDIESLPEPPAEREWLRRSKIFLSTQERGMLLLHQLEGVDSPQMRRDLAERLARHLEDSVRLNLLYRPPIRYRPLPLSSPSAPPYRRKIAAVVHLYYMDLFDELIGYLDRIHPRPDLYMTIHFQSDPREITRRLRAKGYPHVDVRRQKNRGRDLAPFLIDFGPTLLSYDLCCKIHGKKSLDAGTEQKTWRTHLLENLLGSRELIEDILRRFAEDRKLGLLFPDAFSGIPHHGFTWTDNAPLLPDLLRRLSLDALLPLLDAEQIDFPAGSMFWVRPRAIRQLLDSPLGYEDFAEEPIPPDGTNAHAIERLFAYVTRFNGYDFIEINHAKKRYSVNETHKNYLFE